MFDAEPLDGGADTVRDECSALGVDAGQQQREFLAARSCCNIDLAEGPADRFRHPLEAFVAGRMTEAVVVFLEVVDIDRDQCKRFPIALGARPFLAQAVVEQPAVGESGQRIGGGLRGKQCIGFG